jgi:glycosyltransferase involved in cell wall biosynthesis
MSARKRLKILFITFRYPSNENPTKGIFIQEQAKAASLYNEVIVIYSESYYNKSDKSLKIVSDKNEDGIRTIRIRYKFSPPPKNVYLGYLWRMRQESTSFLHIKKVFKKLLESSWKPDIIHAHIYLAGVPAVMLGRKYDIPVLITEHFSNFPLGRLNKIEVIKARFAMRRAKVILPVSRNLQKSIESYGIKNQFKIVPNVVDTKLFYPSFKNQDKGREKIKILFVGGLVPIKGIPYLLKAIAKIKDKRGDFILDIVGDGENKEKYKKLAEELGLNNFVNFQGEKSKTEIARFMRNCDFYIQPSLYETFGVAYIEAMACGKPVIGTEKGGPKEFITKDVGILVPPRNTTSLVEAINYMLAHYQDYSPKKISQYAVDHFGYKKVGQEINKIYREVIKNYGR